MKYKDWSSSLDSLSTTFILGSSGRWPIECSSSQILHKLMLFNSQSLRGCFFLHFGQNTDKVVSTSPCVFFIFSFIIWADKVLRRLILKFSNKLPISTLVTPPLANFYIQTEGSRIALIPLVDPLELLRQSLIISSNISCNMTHFPSKFKCSRQSSLIPLMNIVLKTSGVRWLNLGPCRL